jgi:hypothetical protein
VSTSEKHWPHCGLLFDVTEDMSLGTGTSFPVKRPGLDLVLFDQIYAVVMGSDESATA